MTLKIIIKHPWVKYKVGKPSATSNWVEPACQEFTTVSHVAHISTAISILTEKVFRAKLVYDESLLNKDRILVVWVSPNDWDGAGGYRYGNIRFFFDWEKLIKDMNYYWVEDIDYKIPACRILITDQDRRSILRPYDPTLGDGPWWHDKPNNKHYRNGSSICLEFLVEKDLSLADVKSIEFVDHHPQWCSINRSNPTTCPEIGMSRHQAGWRFIANVIGMGLDLDADMISYISHDKIKGIDPSFREAANDIMLKIKSHSNRGNIYRGCVQSGDAACEPLARAIIGAIGRNNITEAKALIKLFQSELAAIGAYTAILEALIKSKIHIM